MCNVSPRFSPQQVFDILNGKPYEPEFTSDDLLAQGELLTGIPSTQSLKGLREKQHWPDCAVKGSVAYSRIKSSLDVCKGACPAVIC